MKNLFLAICGILLCFPVYGQRERNYIYLFDCTRSMIEVVDIWEPTKQYLKDDIERLSPESTIAIVPFQGGVHPTILFNRRNYCWSDINKQFDTYLVSPKTNTNICSAWDEGVKYIDVNKDNYFFILTDGEDNIKGMDAVCTRIREWCGKYKNSYAFYVMLTKAAREKKMALIDAIGSCNSIRLVDAKGHIRPFGAFGQDSIRTNTLEIEKKANLSFSTVGKYKASVNCLDTLFNVFLENDVIDSGRAVFRLSAKKSVKEIIKLLNGADKYSFVIQVKSDDVDILNSEIRIDVVNKPEKVLYLIDKKEENIGEASYYPSFLFWGEKQPDTLRCDLQPIFNRIARSHCSNVHFEIEAEDGAADFVVLMNGSPCPNNEFIFDSTSSKGVLSIIFKNSGKEGKRYFHIGPTQIKEIDRINNSIPREYELSIRAEYDIEYNPLLILLVCLLVTLMVSLLLWFGCIRLLVYPRFKVGSVVVTEPYYVLKRIHGARKIVFTKESARQGFLNYIFTGRVVYESNPIWTKQWEMEPRKQAIRPVTRGKYLIVPFTIQLDKNTEYEIQNIESNQRAKITIN